MKRRAGPQRGRTHARSAPQNLYTQHSAAKPTGPDPTRMPPGLVDESNPEPVRTRPWVSPRLRYPPVWCPRSRRPALPNPRPPFRCLRPHISCGQRAREQQTCGKAGRWGLRETSTAVWSCGAGRGVTVVSPVAAVVRVGILPVLEQLRAPAGADLRSEQTYLNRHCTAGCASRKAALGAGAGMSRAGGLTWRTARREAWRETNDVPSAALPVRLTGFRLSGLFRRPIWYRLYQKGARHGLRARYCPRLMK